MNHTPGPWGIETSSQGLIVVGSNEQPVVLIPFFSEGEWEKDEWEKLGLSKRNVELAANARLIAAAPELYEAIQAVDMALTGQKTSLEEWANTSRIVRAALAKVRGEDKCHEQP